MNNEMIRNHYDAFSRMEAFRLKYGAQFTVNTAVVAKMEGLEE